MSFTKDDSAKTKGIATILLLVHHLFLNDRGYEVNTWLISEDLLRTLAVAARVCVWVFVFISAYGITSLFYRKPESQSIQKFVAERWLSLMKGYWFVWILVFISLFLFGKQPMKTYNNNGINLLLDLFAWSDFFKTPSLRSAWWYMNFAQIQVILLPLLIILCKKVGGMIAFFSLYIGSLYINSGIVSNSGGDYLMYIYATLFGVLCVQYDFFGSIRKYVGLRAVIQLVLVLIMVLAGISVRFAVSYDNVATNIRRIYHVCWAISAIGIALLVFLLKGKYGILERILLFLGNHSGNIYLIHMLLVGYLGKYIFITKSVLGTVAILLATSCVLSVAIEWLKKLLRYNQFIGKLANVRAINKNPDKAISE